MKPYVGETHWATSYFFCYYSLKSASSAEICEGPVIPTSSDEGENSNAIPLLLAWFIQG